MKSLKANLLRWSAVRLESTRPTPLSSHPKTVTGPDDGEIPLKPLERIHIRAGITKATVLDGPVKLDPYLFAPDVKVQDLATVKEEVDSQDRLRFDVNNTFAPGQFYELPQLAMHFCKAFRAMSPTFP
jgi:hypothetical protein